jgi:hypothetical protein
LRDDLGVEFARGPRSRSCRPRAPHRPQSQRPHDDRARHDKSAALLGRRPAHGGDRRAPTTPATGEHRHEPEARHNSRRGSSRRRLTCASLFDFQKNTLLATKNRWPSLHRHDAGIEIARCAVLRPARKYKSSLRSRSSRWWRPAKRGRTAQRSRSRRRQLPRRSLPVSPPRWVRRPVRRRLRPRQPPRQSRRLRLRQRQHRQRDRARR